MYFLMLVTRLTKNVKMYFSGEVHTDLEEPCDTVNYIEQNPKVVAAPL